MLTRSRSPRRLVPKRVNKKELNRLSSIEDLQQLVLKADSVGVRMDEVQQLKDVVESSTAVLAKIETTLAEAVDECVSLRWPSSARLDSHMYHNRALAVAAKMGAGTTSTR